MKGFVLIGKIRDICDVFRVLAEFEWKFPALVAQLDGKAIKLGEQNKEKERR